MTYKITFTMISPIVYMTLPIFDSILAYAKYQGGRRITDIKSPSGIEIDNIELPIRKHSDYDFYLCSYMFSEHTEEGIDSWKKRWDSRHDFIADFGKARKRVNTASGSFKSYDIPLVTQSSRHIWFYFDGEPEEIDKILINLSGIGKKTSMGYGWYSGYKIEEGDSDYLLCRPLPIEFMKTNIKELEGYKIEISFGAWRYPYWLSAEQGRIIIPKKL